ncbi:OmpA family protein [Myxococcota bacterium]|nr:OmpA family protein [Myxococcota bacterium]
MTSTRLTKWIVAIGLAGAVTACATATPRDLVQARATYNRVAGGPAAESARSHLMTARKALDRAEESFAEHGDNPDTRDLAYIAERLAQIAEAQAELSSAIASRRATEQELEIARVQAQRQQQQQLAGRREQQRMTLENERRARFEAEQRAAQAEQQAEQARRELEQQAARSQSDQARLEAEQRLREAQAEAERARREADEFQARLNQSQQEQQASLDASRREQQAEQQRQEEEQRRQQEQRAQQLEETRQQLSRLGEVREEARGTVLNLSGSVLFTSGQSRLLPSAQERLYGLVTALRSMGPSQRIVIEGYTDSRGSDEMNQRLSERRAQSVKRFLVQQGIEASRIETVGRGEEDPVAENDTPEGRANNRRVEIVLARPVS